ncbi:hypothetical protein DR094_00095 [Mycoplasma flocculare]|uniref:TM2 domain-containing protein n=1 Tax=Mesomycoplasma flocculare TaxID=2128 RepID=A0AAW9XCL5_MESFC|nr:hypothetical protein [Mesomycoplasma flocculare]MXR39395.1 hypothetical protein [Mycoplasma sp. MF12]MXR56413.1 hypothetical protein [Mesomycoplasma flocculare]
MPYLDKQRKDGLLQSDAFYNELFLGLFGFGFWYLGRVSLAIIRFTFTIVGLLMIFIPQMMYLGSTAQDEIKNDVYILTIVGGVILAVSLLWNIITTIMIFTADMRDDRGGKILHWGTEIEDNPDLEDAFDTPVEEEESTPVLAMETESVIEETEALDLQVESLEPESLEPESLEPESLEPEPVTEPVYFEPVKPVFEPEPEFVTGPVVAEPVFGTQPVKPVKPVAEPVAEPPVFEPVVKPVFEVEENFDIARQIEMINTEQVQISQLQTVQKAEIPVDFSALKHIHHTTFTIQEIESGIVDEHFEIRGQHDISCHK